MGALISLIYWAAALCVLIVMTALMRLLSLVASPQGFSPTVKALCRLLVRCFPVRVRVEGLHHLERRRQYLFIANHVNVLDAFLLEGYIPRIFTALEREKHFTWPFYRTFITILRHIPLSLDRGPGTAVALRRADRTLRAGTCLLVMPEGNWTEDGTLGQFGRGAFRLAVRNKVVIAPIVVAGFFHAIPPDQWRVVRAGMVRMVFGEPIDPSDHPDLDDVMLAQMARERMQVMLKAAGDRGPKRLRVEAPGDLGHSHAA